MAKKSNFTQLSSREKRGKEIDDQKLEEEGGDPLEEPTACVLQKGVGSYALLGGKER